MANNNKCKCGGDFVNEHGIRKCLHCGREYMNPLERQKYLEEHKDEIIADFKKLGRNKTARKWQLSSATPARLLKRWGVVSKDTIGSNGSDNHLPSLPEFSNDWSSEVQLKWLEIWGNASIKTGGKL